MSLTLHLTPDYFTQTPAHKKTNFTYAIADGHVTPEISIITAFFNTGAIFLETVSSVLNQSFQNFEWLIINDGSSDPASLQLLSELLKKDPRIKVIHNEENVGLPASRNVGIGVAKGNFLFFIDSDDLLDPTAIEKFWLFLKVNTEFSFCTSWHTGFGTENYLWRKGFEHGKAFIERNYVQPTFMARKSLFSHLQFDGKIRYGFEDWDFWLNCASHGHWGYSIQEFLYWYRKTGDAAAKWKDWDMGERMRKFHRSLRLSVPPSLCGSVAK